MADLYTGLQKDARRGMLKTIRETDKQISAIYGRAADDLTKLASSQKAGGLTKRWQSDMADSLKARMVQLNGEVGAAIKSAAGSAAKLPATANAQWLNRVLEKAKGGTGGDAFRSVLTRTSDEALRSVVNGQAYLDAKSLSSRIWKTNKRAQDGINEVLQQGIAQKKSAYQIAKELEAYVKPDVREAMDWREVYPDLPEWLDDRWTKVERHAQNVARTSINQAYHIAMKEAAAANPFATAIHWELSGEHYERQVRPFGEDVCDEYSMHNEGLGGGNFPIDAVPLPHAMCLCDQWAVTVKTLDQCADQLKGWLDGEADEELDKAFGNWKETLQGNGPVRQVDYTATDRHNRMMDRIIAQKWAQRMKVADRETMVQAFLDASEDELNYFAYNGDALIRKTAIPDTPYSPFVEKIKKLHDDLKP